MRRRILLASNGSKPAREAGLLLRRLADPQQVEVTVNVCDSVEFSFPQDPWRYGKERKPRPTPKEVAEQEVAALQAEGFSAEASVGSGVPAAQILEKIAAERYDVTVMGAGSSRWLDNLLLGSTATRVLHGSGTSVLLVHRLAGPPEGLRVLLASDGSPDSAHAMSVLLGIADRGKVAVTVASVADRYPRLGHLIPKSVPDSEVRGYLESSAEKNAEMAAGALREHGLKVATRCPIGEPVQELLGLAKEADLVVCGSRGMGGASRVLLGSVSNQLARLAPAALICRRSGAGSEEA